MKGAPTLQIKAAVVQGRAIKPAEVTDLASLPGRPELYAKLLFLLQAPMQQLVSVLSAVPRDLVTVLVAGREEEDEAGASITPLAEVRLSRQRSRVEARNRRGDLGRGERQWPN